ncbi:unnamed protein product [Paramecium primaurelia]|uniref:Phosphodiesterase n=1 Tax=Paramecium primaurelia TaxID=5886 RepID=A0A8S1L3R0_PARPR|nr:unnamed protein product [Paramecium primaurelia]
MSLQQIEQLINQIKTSYQMPNKEFQNTFKHFENCVQSLKKENQEQLNKVYKALKRFRRRLENELKLNQTDYHAFIKKWKTMNITFVPLVYDVKLDFSKKIQTLKYEDLINVNFNHHHYTSKEMLKASMMIFHHLEVEQYANYNNLENLLTQINLNYNIVSYHNFTHAFALFQLLFCVYEKSDLKYFVTKQDIFAALLASLSHDLNHKGVNNLYKVKKSKKINKNICEQAVLETMHVSTLFNIMAKNQQLNFLNQLPNIQQQEIKRIIVSSILATDMGQHFNIFSSFKDRVNATIDLRDNQNITDPLIRYRGFNKDNFDDRKFILNVLVHACDISNPCLEWDAYMKWSFLLAQEFQDQTIKEAAKGLEVTTMLQYKDKLTFFNGQTFFLNTFVLPQWQTIATLYPSLIDLPNEVKRNLEILEEEKKKLTN